MSFATISGRGGTTGRAAGCPAMFGLAGGRSGPRAPMDWPGPCGVAGCAALGIGDGGRGVGRGCAGLLGMVLGRGAPGMDAGPGTPCVPSCPGVPKLRADGGALGGSAKFGGKGWRGPERIWPGFGAAGALGTGLAGIGMDREI